MDTNSILTLFCIAFIAGIFISTYSSDKAEVRETKESFRHWQVLNITMSV